MGNARAFTREVCFVPVTKRFFICAGVVLFFLSAFPRGIRASYTLLRSGPCDCNVEYVHLALFENK